MRVFNAFTDYPRTLRTWGNYMNANLTPEVFGINPLPTCDASREKNNNYDAMVRKWHYLFAYASVGFARGHVTWYAATFFTSRIFGIEHQSSSHMWVLTRGVSISVYRQVLCVLRPPF
jgi:hypothetical protein